MTEYEERFYSFFYIFAICHVREFDMKFMLWRFACGMTLRGIAKVAGVSHERCDQIIKRGCKRIKNSMIGKEILSGYIK